MKRPRGRRIVKLANDEAPQIQKQLHEEVARQDVAPELKSSRTEPTEKPAVGLQRRLKRRTTQTTTWFPSCCATRAQTPEPANASAIPRAPETTAETRFGGEKLPEHELLVA